MRKFLMQSFVAVLITAVLLASVGSVAVSAHETLWSGKTLSTVSNPAATVTWDMPDGLDTSPPYFNVCHYEGAVEVTLADVDSTMPDGLLIWSTSMTFYKKGWRANTLTTLLPGSYYICFVPTASVWEIPQEPTSVDGITIESLLVTADHCYLKTYSWGYKVGKEQEYHIECIVSDAGNELVYEWSCTDGELSGQGSLVTWIAPDASTQAIITVTVYDNASNMISKSVVLDVVACSACTFGC